MTPVLRYIVHSTVLRTHDMYRRTDIPKSMNNSQTGDYHQYRVLSIYANVDI